NMSRPLWMDWTADWPGKPPAGALGRNRNQLDSADVRFGRLFRAMGKPLGPGRLWRAPVSDTSWQTVAGTIQRRLRAHCQSRWPNARRGPWPWSDVHSQRTGFGATESGQTTTSHQMA